MRLESDFHDYYDHALGYGIDQRLYYKRITRKVELKLHTTLSWPTDVFGGVLGFCGRLYPFVEILKRERVANADESLVQFPAVETYYAFSPEEYEAKERSWRSQEGYLRCEDKYRWRKLKQFYKDWNLEIDEIFRKHNVPIWVLPRLNQFGTGFVNPRLKDYGFERIKNAVEAFQEISVYIGNVLIEQRTPRTIPDNFIIEQHGFDLKTSFRKSKTRY